MNPNQMMLPPLNQPHYGANPVQAVARFFKKYATFKGRASRSEFWWVIGMLVVVNLILNGISTVSQPVALIIQWIWLAVIFVPYMALAARRSHDTNRSGAIGISFVVCYYIMVVLATAVGNFATQHADELIHVDEYALAGVGFAAIFMVLFALAALILLIFVALGSDPRGMRFDEGMEGINPQAMYPGMGYVPQGVPMGQPQSMPINPAQFQQAPMQAPFAPSQPVQTRPAQPQQAQPFQSQPAVPMQQPAPANPQPQAGQNPYAVQPGSPAYPQQPEAPTSDQAQNPDGYPQF